MILKSLYNKNKTFSLSHCFGNFLASFLSLNELLAKWRVAFYILVGIRVQNIINCVCLFVIFRKTYRRRGVFIWSKQMNYDTVLDGNLGEGGGQVIRTAMTLSCVLGRSLRIYNVRGGREKPGLQRQHVMSILAASEICGGKLSGCDINSTEFTFVPGQIKNGDYTFDIGSAGSTILVLQTVVPILWFAAGQSTVRIKGGTHNGSSPSFDFYAEVFCPLMPVKTECRLLRHGFYPSGGGGVFVKVDPYIKRLNPLILLDKGMILSSVRTMVHSKAMDVCSKINDGLPESFKCHPVEVDANGKGMPVLTARFQYSEITEMISVYHQKDLKTTTEFTNSVSEYLHSTAPVDEHLADQLLLPLALVSGGTYRAVSISKYSKHFLTCATIIETFIGSKIHIKPVADGYEVRVV